MEKKTGFVKVPCKRGQKNQPSRVKASQAEPSGREGVLQRQASAHVDALEWKVDQPLEVHCDFVSVVDSTLELASSTGNPAGLILVDPGRPIEEIPGATRMGPDLEAALAGGEVRESFGVLPEDHFAIAVIGCSQDDLEARARGILRTCQAVGLKTPEANRPPRAVAFHFCNNTRVTGERILKAAELALAQLDPGEDFRFVPYFGGGG